MRSLSLIQLFAFLYLLDIVMMLLIDKSIDIYVHYAV